MLIMDFGLCNNQFLYLVCHFVNFLFGYKQQTKLATQQFGFCIFSLQFKSNNTTININLNVQQRESINEHFVIM